jgi:tetratricopeptide (TPR) repeat protein
MNMKRLACLMVAGMLCACTGGNRHTEVENPYIEKSRHFTQAGMTAMQRERWAYAQISFERALASLQLTDDQSLIAQAWYNLGMARKFNGETERAQTALQTAWETANQQHDTLTALRARLALALLQERPEWFPSSLRANLPADIHLSAARLAQKQRRLETAREEYLLALKRSDASRQGLTYKGQAYLGLGLLALEKSDAETARHNMQRALALFRQVGSPKLIAYTLLRLATVDTTDPTRAANIRRALTIYRTLNDESGQKACMEALKGIGAAPGTAE